MVRIKSAVKSERNQTSAGQSSSVSTVSLHSTIFCAKRPEHKIRKMERGGGKGVEGLSAEGDEPDRLCIWTMAGRPG
jgi:hypothetical protein